MVSSEIWSSDMWMSSEPKLRPMAASTPTERRVKDKNDIVTTPLSKLKKLEPRPCILVIINFWTKISKMRTPGKENMGK
ncbi:hypothetical protein NQ318_020937 [Aromia moschata]|uniref:Uncharacterized protein n=1 Tax=Aromia moschata TaxID=1265417 RepID=A0AAV8Y0D0_9CUCU|nr:hypothetical protein NQ318_020937 [Aromia moschata]